MTRRTKQTNPSRRRFLALGTGAFVVAAWPFAASRTTVLVRRSLPVMGTMAEFALAHHDRREAHAAIDAAFEELVFVDRTMSRFRDDSDVGRINNHSHTDIDDATTHVLREALRWAKGTGGAFDPCLGKSTSLQPNRRLYRALEVASGTAHRTDRDAAVDLGGIAKGYAVDRAVQTLRDQGISRGLVNAGGDLYAMGLSDDGDPWRVGVRSPQHPSRIVRTIRICDEAVATSGDYFQPGHLLDPKTGAPYDGTRHSLTVTAKTCMAADAAATALFGMKPERARETLRRLDRSAKLVCS